MYIPTPEWPADTNWAESSPGWSAEGQPWRPSEHPWPEQHQQYKQHQQQHGHLQSSAINARLMQDLVLTLKSLYQAYIVGQRGTQTPCHPPPPPPRGIQTPRPPAPLPSGSTAVGPSIQHQLMEGLHINLPSTVTGQPREAQPIGAGVGVKGERDAIFTNTNCPYFQSKGHKNHNFYNDNSFHIVVISFNFYINVSST